MDLEARDPIDNLLYPSDDEGPLRLAPLFLQDAYEDDPDKLYQEETSAEGSQPGLAAASREQDYGISVKTSSATDPVCIVGLSNNQKENDPVSMSRRVANIFKESERLLRETDISLPVPIVKKKSLGEFIANQRSLSAERCAALLSASKRQAAKQASPRLSFDTSPHATGARLVEFSDAPLIVESEDAHLLLRPSWITDMHKKPSSLDLLNAALKAKAKAQSARKQQRMPGRARDLEEKTNSDSDGSQSSPAAVDETNDYEDDPDQLLESEDEEISMCADSSASSHCVSELGDEDIGSGTSSKVTGNEFEQLSSSLSRGKRIVLSDDEPCAEPVEPRLSLPSDKAAFLSLLKDTFEPKTNTKKRGARFIDAEAEEEDERGQLMIVAEEEDLVADATYEDLYESTFGLLAPETAHAGEAEQIRELFHQQEAEDDAAATESILRGMEARKEERLQERELKRMLLARRQYGKAKELQSLEPHPSSLPAGDLSLDQLEDMAFAEPSSDRQLFKAWRARNAAISFTTTERPGPEFCSAFHSSIKANIKVTASTWVGCTTSRTGKTHRPVLLDKSADHLSRLQEISLMPDKKSQAFTSRKMSEQ